MNIHQLEKLATNLHEIPNSSFRIFPAESVEESYQEFYQTFLKENYHAGLSYLENDVNVTARFNLSDIFPEVATIISVAFFYNSKNVQSAWKKGNYKIAKYAWGRDYHNQCRSSLKKVMQEFSFQYRLVTDTTPLPERYLAHLSGLAKPGRNGLMIDSKKGSYFILSFIMLSKKLPFKEIKLLQQRNESSQWLENIQVKNPSFSSKNVYHEEIDDLCGGCTLCVKACPSQAIDVNLAMVDTRRCISFHTIESKKSELRETSFPAGIKKNKWIFGCDICQMVCPYNKKVELPQSGLFDPWPVATNLSHALNIDQDYAGSALKRAKVSGLQRNIDFVDTLNQRK